MNELAKEIHSIAKSKGWWDAERSFPEIIALCHSELSEALEEYRVGSTYLYSEFFGEGGDVLPESFPEGIKPQGIAVELADVIIRILDFCGKEDIDIEGIVHLKHEYNKTRPYRHGGKMC